MLLDTSGQIRCTWTNSKMSTEYDYEIYGKLDKVKIYERNIVGTVILSGTVLIGTV